MEVDDGDAVSVKPINGIDAVEALLLVIMVIGLELSSIRHSKYPSLIWLSGNRRDLAFPTHPDFSLSTVLPPDTLR
jgi:hypothetical protein